MSIEDNWRHFIVENHVEERSIFTYLQGLTRVYFKF